MMGPAWSAVWLALVLLAFKIVVLHPVMDCGILIVSGQLERA